MKALVLFAGIGQGLYCLVLFLTALFLILLILIQRGRGGGLSGAFGGGFGGQSAFGAKAGDTFTKVTIVAATVWICLCLIGVKFLGKGASVLGSANPPTVNALNPDIDLEATPTDGAETAANTPAADGPAADGPAADGAATSDDSTPSAAGASSAAESPPAAEDQSSDEGDGQ